VYVLDVLAFASCSACRYCTCCRHTCIAGQAALAPETQTVFVDGPTGFTFIYVLDDGWKFVGRIVEQDR